jgi:hypothetical protein
LVIDISKIVLKFAIISSTITYNEKNQLNEYNYIWYILSQQKTIEVEHKYFFYVILLISWKIFSKY